MTGMLCTTSPSDDTRTIRIFCTLKKRRRTAGDRHKDAILSRPGDHTGKKRPHAVGVRRFSGMARRSFDPRRAGGPGSERQLDVRLRGRQHAAEIRLDALES
ncbi:hypothetical protein, partial [Burkholderia sp. FL-7-2-10-S1-D7]|uniref:hypothetical protein n=1 Tax=Burkholderia sp. FL-7-2-10-S1-D7 TaxID=1637866 RepID=UPI001C54CB7B